MPIWRPPKRDLVVHTFWLRWFPGKPLGFWASVAKEIKRRGIRKGDKRKITQVCHEVWKAWCNIYGKGE